MNLRSVSFMSVCCCWLVGLGCCYYAKKLKKFAKQTWGSLTISNKWVPLVSCSDELCSYHTSSWQRASPVGGFWSHAMIPNNAIARYDMAICQKQYIFCSKHSEHLQDYSINEFPKEKSMFSIFSKFKRQLLLRRFNNLKFKNSKVLINSIHRFLFVLFIFVRPKYPGAT